MTRPGRLAFLPFIATVALLAGCAPFQDDTPPPREYLLIASAAIPANVNTDRWPQPLAIERPEVAPGLDDPRIRIRRPGGELDHIADVRWAAPLPTLVEDALRRASADHFGEPLPLARARGEEATPHRLQIRLEAFHPVYSETDGETRPPPTLEIVLVARLVNSRSGETVATVRTQGSGTAAENRVPAIVRGLGDLLGDAYARALERIDAELGQV